MGGCQGKQNKKAMQPLSQRDPRWGETLLGFSKTTKIKDFGCTITCVSMLADLTPAEVNERLKSVNGYANTNLIIWSKIKEAIPWLEFEWRGYSYENDKVSACIAANGGCLVEVDGTPIGGTKHWVLYVGNQKLIDPWDGKEKPTSSYKAIGYATIKVMEKPTMMYKGYDLTNQDSMKVAVDVLVDVVKNNVYYKRSEVHDRYNVDSLDQLDNVIAGLKSRITTLENELGTYKAEVGNKLEIISRLQSELLTAQTDNKTLYTRLDDAAKTIEQLGKDKGSLAIEVEQLKIRIKTLESLPQGGITGDSTLSQIVKWIKDLFYKN